jgi:type III pantothenate kinase
MNQERILTLDAGNTHIRAASVYNGEVESVIRSVPTASFKESGNAGMLIRTLCGSGSYSGVVYSSVVPELNSLFDTTLLSATEHSPLCISSSIKLNFDIRYEPVSSLGADRITNAAAAVALYPGRDCILVDAGTAVTFCVVLSEAVFDGGLIVPGCSLAADALYSRTSKLPRAEITADAPLVGRNTLDGIRGGILHGWASLVDGLVSRIEQQYDRQFQLLLTGGGASLLSGRICRKHILDDLLTMKGLGILYRLNDR